MKAINKDPDAWTRIPLERVDSRALLMMRGLISTSGGTLQKGADAYGRQLNYPGCGFSKGQDGEPTLLHRALRCPFWERLGETKKLESTIGRHADPGLRISQAISGTLGEKTQIVVLKELTKIALD